MRWSPSCSSVAMDERYPWLTVGIAQEIREYRREWGSWRSIADSCYERFGGGWTPSWNQLIGQEICRQAAALLGDDPDADPWN